MVCLSTVGALLVSIAAVSSSSSAVAAAPSYGNGTAAPTVTVRNGTYSGVFSPEYDQDFFLGLPYAKVSVIAIREYCHLYYWISDSIAKVGNPYIPETRALQLVRAVD
jgi:hypothetical protein